MTAGLGVAEVVSADGTPIAVEQHGSGAPVVLVGGAFNDRTTVLGLAIELADEFSAVVYDRRGRGASGDAPEYAVEREIEDLAAVIEHVGGSASVFGHSSGAVLVLAATAQGLPIERVAAYEPPYSTPEHPRPDVLDQVRAQIAAGDLDGAVTTFMAVVGTPPEEAAAMRLSPAWRWLTSLAHTLPYDLTICGRGNPLPENLADIKVPALLIGGGESPEGLQAGARAAADVIPGARHETLAGQDHAVLRRPEALRELLLGFFG